MNKVLLYGVLTFLFLSCKEKGSVVSNEDSSSHEISTERWPIKTTINAKASTILKDWPEFRAMETSFDGLYNVANREDLTFVIEDLVEVQKVLEASSYPETFDIPQIRSRQKVFKTFFLKVKGNLEYRLDVEEPILEMINAYNALRNQFNVTINNNLDTQLIFDEE